MRLNVSLKELKRLLLLQNKKSFELAGTLRNTQREYAIVFEATENGEHIEPDKLLKILFEKQNIQILLQVITYWINEEEYHIDFSLWKGNGI